MRTNGNSSAESVRALSGEADAQAGCPRKSGSRRLGVKAALAALASLTATGLALTLAAGPAGAAAKPAWSMTAGNIQQLSQADPGTAAHFFNTPSSYGAGASLVRTPVQAGYATTPVLSYGSYAQFKSDISGGKMSYPYQWVMFDPEESSGTPVSEQKNPIKYMTLFGQLAHAHGLKVIQAPALDLGSVTGSALPRHPGEKLNQWFVRVDIAGAAAAAGDIFQLQDESNTTAAGGAYATMFNTAEGQAQAANPNVKVYSEVSTVNGTAAQMAAAAQSISPDGFYVASAGNMAQTDQFFQLMQTAGY